jgi:transcriptional regulator with XRE-family HTH domain
MEEAMTLAKLGPLTRERRGDRGLREAAKEIGVSPATLSRIENGQVPDLETFQAVCRWLEIDPGVFLGGVGGGARSAVAHVHFKKDGATSEKTAKALAELILAADRALAFQKS